jgi:hypothetical protein
LALLSPRETLADAIRCGDQLASTGASLYEVRAVCGEPDAAFRRVEHRTVVQQLPGPCVITQGRRVCGSSVATIIEVVIDDWTYDFGNNRFLHFVKFEDGKLVTVTSGGYGKKPAAS